MTRKKLRKIMVERSRHILQHLRTFYAPWLVKTEYNYKTETNANA